MPTIIDQLNKDKFAELILHIAKVSAGDTRFGATKLNKILFFSDWLYYRTTLKSITGAKYKKLDHGPVPTKMLPVQQQLIREKRLAIQETAYFGRIQKRPVALKDPDLSVLTAQEIAVVDSVIASLMSDNAKAVSDLSHYFVGWNLAEMGELIPIEVSLVEHFPEVTPADIACANSLVEKAQKVRAA